MRPGGEIFIFCHFRSFSVFSGFFRFFPVFFRFFRFRSPWAPWVSMFNGFSLIFIVFLLIFDDFHDFHDFEYLLRRSWGSMSFFFFCSSTSRSVCQWLFFEIIAAGHCWLDLIMKTCFFNNIDENLVIDEIMSKSCPYVRAGGGADR